MALTGTFCSQSVSYGGGLDSGSEDRSAPWSDQLVSEITEITVPITSDRDILAARQKAHALAKKLGFSRIEGTLVATTISEVARDILLCSGMGEVVLKPLRQEKRTGIMITAAYRVGTILSTASLPTRLTHLVDDIEFSFQASGGAILTAIKWRH